MSVMERLRERAEAAPSVGDLLEETLDETGYLRGAARPSARSRRRAGSRTSRSWWAWRASTTPTRPRSRPLEEFLQQIALFSEQDALRDDEGTVTLMTLHNAKGLEFPVVFMIGCEDGRVPALARDRDGRPRGGAAALLRRHHARQARALPDLRAHARALRRRATGTCRAASSTRSPPSSPTARTPSPPAAGGRRTPCAGGPRDAAEPRAGAASFALGDDVVHANFGDGVVIGHGARRHGGRALRGRRLRAQADGRLRADSQALRIARPMAAFVRNCAPGASRLSAAVWRPGTPARSEGAWPPFPGRVGARSSARWCSSPRSAPARPRVPHRRPPTPSPPPPTPTPARTGPPRPSPALPRISAMRAASRCAAPTCAST